MASLAPAYLPRRPTESKLYEIVRTSLETFLNWAKENYAKPLPKYVEQDLREYLQCGVFAHGFVRVHCDHDLLVAFSCKGRGICPSCTGRRMSNSAAHLVDRVFPDVAVRQFVLSLPFELRALAAFKADVMGALNRIFLETLSSVYRKRARREGIAEPQFGAVSLSQRFGGSINLHVHFHVMVMDGVFARDDNGEVAFHEAPAPTPSELNAIVERVHQRSIQWLKDHGYLKETPIEERSNEAPELSAIEACGAMAIERGQFATLNGRDEEEDQSDEAPGSHSKMVADYEHFNLHAGVRIAQGDDRGRERLFRYGLRPPLSLERIRRLPDGRIGYRVKYARKSRAKYRIMTPLEFMARISSLIPPPRYPLLRYYGVIAPRSSWRQEVVPKPPSSLSAKSKGHGSNRVDDPSKKKDAEPGKSSESSQKRTRESFQNRFQSMIPRSPQGRCLSFSGPLIGQRINRMPRDRFQRRL